MRQKMLDPSSPWASYQVLPVSVGGGVNAIPDVTRAAGPGESTLDSSPWSPDNPLFIFGLLLAATLGLVAAATELRVGPVKVGASVGKS